MTKDEILQKAREQGDGTIDAVIEIAFQVERERIVGYLRTEAVACHARRAYAGFSILRRVANRIEVGMPTMGGRP